MNENETSGQMNQTGNMPNLDKPESGKGTMVGSIIIIIIIIIGAIYLFRNQAEAPANPEEEVGTEESTGTVVGEETTGSNPGTNLEADLGTEVEVTP